MIPFIETNLHLLCDIVARVALVSPDRSRQIEAILLRMAQTGQLRGRVSEEQLIELLEQVSTFHSVQNFMATYAPSRLRKLNPRLR